MGAGGSKLNGFFSIRGSRHKRIRVVAPLTPKGYFPVCVGLGNKYKRFMIHTTMLGDADLLELLCISAEEYGFSNPGVLKIPYDVKRFEEVMRMKNKHQTLRIMIA
ncbi:auxin-responsive protein SAUR72-like [Elaeis guineensis]|uniref:auxin-responsive protein SAUR72-like n=1 Tax=Elaeis guineensis var. tenera TaxID=51953 RepID=UPI003C6D0CB5